jgi:hypothetical protein
MKDTQLVLNRIQTPDGTILTSYHRHDYKTHLDKNGHEYMIDGGLEYHRSNVVSEAPHENLCVYSDADFTLIRQVYCRGGRGKDGLQPLTYVPLANMSNDWLLNCIEYNNDRGNSNCFANKMYKAELSYRVIEGIYIKD